MRFLFSTIIALLVVFNAAVQAQVSVYKSKGVIDDLKGRTTFFVIPVWDTAAKAEYEKAISSVWTLTPVQIGTPKEAERLYSRSKYAFFTIGHEKVRCGSVTFNSTGDFYQGAYEFWLGPLDGKHEEDKSIIAGALLCYDYPTSVKIQQTDIPKTFSGRQKDLVHRANVQLYSDNKLLGFSPGIVKGYVKRTNDLLLEEETWKRAFDNFTNDTALISLHKDTLYIPTYMMNLVGGPSVSFKSREVDISNLSEYYNYPVKIVSDTEMYNLSNSPTRPIYFLSMAIDYCTSFRILTIYEAKSGTTVWTKHFTGGPARFYQSDLTWIGKRSKVKDDD